MGPQGTIGPWHQGHAVTCEVLGVYVTIVAGDPLVAEAVAELLTGRRPLAPAEPALVSRARPPVDLKLWEAVAPTKRQVLL